MSSPAATATRNDDRTRQILDAVSDAFVSIDADGNIIDWNREAEVVFGWPDSETIGKPLAGTLLSPDGDENRELALGRFLSTGEGSDVSRGIEVLARHREGYQFPVEMTVAPMLERGGLTFNLFLRDITERKHMERMVEETQVEVLERLAMAAEYRDEETGEHNRRVGQLSAVIAEELGLDATTVSLIGRAAPLHDVGKIGIPDAVLVKPGPLTAEEFEMVKRHTTIGAAILAGRGFPLLETAEQIALAHHERWDGSGYPHGLKRHATPLAGRIVGVADVFDALTHERPYKQAWPRERAIVEIRAQSGRHFDPRVVEAFLNVHVGVHPIPISRSESKRPDCEGRPIPIRKRS
jgi:putative two-component system response regulator